MAHLNETPPSLADLRADVPSEVIRVVQRMMAKDPADRFQTPRAVVEALQPFSRPPAGESPAIEAKTPIAPPVADSPPEADPLDIPIPVQPSPSFL